MYASTEQREAEIEAGARLPAEQLRARLVGTAGALAEQCAELPEGAWSAQVVTAQGRTIAAREVLWLRAREVQVHAVDLDAGMTVDDLPDAFCIALLDDVVAWRAARPGPAVRLVTPDAVRELPGDGPPRRVELSLAAATAWLTGRNAPPDLPALPAWL